MSEATVMGPRTAFVLSGGASLGAIQVGMLAALYERGIRPDLIVGASVGAVNGTFIAARPPTPATATDLAASWCATRRRDVFPLRPLRGLAGFLGVRNHLVAGCGLRRLVEAHVGTAHLEQLPIPLHTVAVDVVTGEELLLSAGPVVEAVLASAAVPGVMAPVRWGERWLIDGGVANNTPISHAVALGAEEIYVLPTGHACALPTPPGSALGMSLHALSLLVHGRLLADIAQHRDHATLIVLPPPCPLAISPLDFGQARRPIQVARADTDAFLDGGGAHRRPIQMRTHRHVPGRAGKNRAGRDAHHTCTSPSETRTPRPIR